MRESEAQSELIFCVILGKFISPLRQFLLKKKNEDIEIDKALTIQ